MPCTYTGSFEGDEALRAREALEKREKYLCAVVRHLEKSGANVDLLLRRAAEGTEDLRGSEIQDWWDNHRRADAHRNQ